jgi:competence protein ComEA
MSAGDRRGAVVLLVLAAAGYAVRCLGGGPSTAPGEVAYRAAPSPRPSLDSLSARAERLSRPLGKDERIDVDQASAEELVRLPRIGPGLALRIVADRERHGPFGDLEALERVPGIGPTVLSAVARHVVFSGQARRQGVEAPALVDLNAAGEAELGKLPGIGPAKARAIVEDRKRRGPFRRVEDLERVPGIGPGTVARLKPLVRVS